MLLTFKYRLMPTRTQHRALQRMLEDQRQLYNAALEERIDCYRKTGKSLSYMDQTKSLTIWRSQDQAAASTPLCQQRWTLKRLDEAFSAFFRRMKDRSGKAGFPRFRGKGWWRSFGFNQFMGIRFDGRRLRFAGVAVRVHIHRALPAGTPRSCVIGQDAKGWSVCFQMKVDAGEAMTSHAAVGLDVGLTHLVALSTGETIPNPRHAKRIERELRRRQRALSRCDRRSNRRKKKRQQVARLHRKVAATRKTYLHQVSTGLVRRFDLIAVEKLNVKGLARSVLAGPVHDASWARLRELLTYKAERAGAQLIEVNARYTSQACSGCGVIVKKDLSVRVHECIDCGLVLDRDHNAALNILHKAVVGLGALNVADYGVRALGNIAPPGEALPGEKSE